MVSIKCTNRVKEITQLPSSDQTGTGGDELAVPGNFIIVLYIISFLYLLYYELVYMCCCYYLYYGEGLVLVPHQLAIARYMHIIKSYNYSSLIGTIYFVPPCLYSSSCLLLSFVTPFGWHFVASIPLQSSSLVQFLWIVSGHSIYYVFSKILQIT